MVLLNFDLERAQDIIKYRFRDKRLLSEALQSPLRDRDDATGNVHESDGNRRLAKLGYAALDLALTEEWFRSDMSHREFGCILVPNRGADCNPESLDLVRKQLLSKEYMGDAAQQKGLHTCLSMSQRQENIPAPPTTMKLVLTAVIGAVWFDRHDDEGFRNVQAVLRTLGSVLFVAT